MSAAEVACRDPFAVVAYVDGCGCSACVVGRAEAAVSAPEPAPVARPLAIGHAVHVSTWGICSAGVVAEVEDTPPPTAIDRTVVVTMNSDLSAFTCHAYRVHHAFACTGEVVA